MLFKYHKPIFKSLLFIVLVSSIEGCSKKENVNQTEVDEKIITDYIIANKIDAKPTGTGLYYLIETQGTGIQPDLASSVTVKYKGYLVDGTVFDQTTNTGATFGLSNVIKGWQEGIPLFKRGGKGKLFIPSALGYGAKAVNKIPANSVLIFDVELLEVR
jgi:FKBP-type peptidyl-prolyl cis-trans isomerase FkpA